MKSQAEKGLGFLRGGGEVGELIRTKDWINHPLGYPGLWPQSLQTAVGIILNSRFPMFIWWGPEMFTIYNDAYLVIAGDKHPQALGERGPEVWSEIWDVVGPLVQQVFETGVANWWEDQQLHIDRHGYVEETYFTFSHSPVLDENGETRGVFCACTETTDKVLAARKALQSENNLRNMIRQAPVAMCILRGPQHVVEIANERMFEVWGKSSSELLHRPIFEGLPEARNQGFEQMLHSVLFTGQPVSAHEIPAQLPRNGVVQEVFLNFVYQPFYDGDKSITGVIAVAIDATEQVLARKKIEESEHQLQIRVLERTEELERQSKLVDNILEHSSNGISVTEMIRDENGHVVDARTLLANDAAVKFSGLPRDIYLTKTAVEIDPNIIGSHYYNMCVNTLTTGEPSLVQYFLEFSQRWLELTVSRMDEDHLIHIFTDVTPMKEAHIRLEKTIEELKRSNVNLEEFAYAASHDLKEPIRKIQLFGDRLKQELSDKLTESQQQHFMRMELATVRMRSLIDDLLTYSHVSGGIINLEEIDLQEKMQAVLEDLELEIEEKAAIINMQPLPVIRGNRRQIQQLFQNLIGNALKYSKKDSSPVIEIRYRRLRGADSGLSLAPEELTKYYEHIEVSDNGIGFDQKDADRIFNVFTRLHGSSLYRGTGVGLSIVKKVMENHKGYVWAVSEPQQGSTFHLLFPADEKLKS